MPETLAQRQLLVSCKVLWCRVAVKLPVLFRRLEILSNGQNVSARGKNIVHEDRDLLVRLAKADHEAGLG